MVTRRAGFAGSRAQPVAAWRVRDSRKPCRAGIRRKDSSFCEQKEAKKLYPFAETSKRTKVFWFFFSKKNALAFLQALVSTGVIVRGSPSR
jgi:hypothetical protein